MCWDGSLSATRIIARTITGPCPVKDLEGLSAGIKGSRRKRYSRHPIVSARKPPNGPPILLPRVAITFT